MTSARTNSIPWRLSRPVRQWAEDIFSSDFSGVRLYLNSAPRRFGAVAFARGGSITMLPRIAAAGAQVFIPVLAHELTHVIQQMSFGSRIRPGLLRDAGYEEEAIRSERRVARSHPFGSDPRRPMLEPAIEQAQFSGYGVVQCASSGYGIMDAPPAAIAGGLQYFQNERLKTSFREAIEHYVRLVKPGEVGVTNWDGDPRKNYVKALLTRIEKKPYLLKELVKDEKVAFDNLSAADRRWVKDELYRAYDNIRKGPSHMEFTTRIRLGHHAEWLDFRTKDCVFAAILRSLKKIEPPRVDTARVRGRDPADLVNEKEQGEAEMEAWLADYFGVSRQITPDVQLIHILESDLGWKNICEAETVADLKAYPGKAFILSYERTPGSETRDAFWHTVYIEIGTNGKVVVTDRQATANGSTGAIAESAKCDAWQIDTTSKGYVDMKQKFQQKFG